MDLSARSKKYKVGSQVPRSTQWDRNRPKMLQNQPQTIVPAANHSASDDVNISIQVGGNVTSFDDHHANHTEQSALDNSAGKLFAKQHISLMRNFEIYCS